MKKFILSLCLIICLLSCTTSSAQGIFFGPPPNLPKLSLTYGEFIEILSQYELNQEDNPQFCELYHGLTTPDNITISICNKRDPATKKLTLIHEVLHIRYYQKGISTADPISDAYIHKLAIEIFNELYGVK